MATTLEELEQRAQDLYNSNETPNPPNSKDHIELILEVSSFIAENPALLSQAFKILEKVTANYRRMEQISEFYAEIEQYRGNINAFLLKEEFVKAGGSDYLGRWVDNEARAFRVLNYLQSKILKGDGREEAIKELMKLEILSLRENMHEVYGEIRNYLQGLATGIGYNKPSLTEAEEYLLFSKGILNRL